MNTPQIEKTEYLNATKLAVALGWSRCYVQAMKRAGFAMPGGRATIAEARDWHRQNPGFRVAKVYQSRQRNNDVNKYKHL